MEKYIMCDHIWVKKGSGSEWGSTFLIANDLGKASSVNSSAFYITMGSPGCEVGVPKVPTLFVPNVPRQPFWKYWLIICKFFKWLHHNPPCAVCSSHTFPKICDFHFNLFVTSQNWNNTDLTFLLKINKTTFFPFRHHCNCCLRRKYMWNI